MREAIHALSFKTLTPAEFDAAKDVAWISSSSAAASRLDGAVDISGAKNAALPILAAALLTNEHARRSRTCRRCATSRTMLRLLEQMGVQRRARRRPRRR